jgi:hypothetical protein
LANDKGRIRHIQMYYAINYQVVFIANSNCLL